MMPAHYRRPLFFFFFFLLLLLLRLQGNEAFHHHQMMQGRRRGGFLPSSSSSMSTPSPPSSHHLEGRTRRWQLQPLHAGGKGFGKKEPKGGEDEEGKQKKKPQQQQSSDGQTSIVRPTFSQRGREQEAAAAAAAAAAAPATPPSRKFQMLYTCNICEGRNLIQVDRIAFTEGIVVARCKHCDAKHLVADNLSKLDFGKTVGKKEGGEEGKGGGKVTLEDILALRGEEAKYLDLKSNPELAAKYDLVVMEDGTVELAPKDKEKGE